ncbi:MAG: type II toxin-antitoxin system VapC family toxin [Gracilimonas sp.]|uniref:type II toxin-antitoxin system VapC family toxin n=1 Tax=Gracilimonas sp. TaxID=1974203 RepID=UPI0019B0B59E|nr:type II toxin-antitoxin system VapC family toxin [Gracilimonas sp.]MBD3617413.1 type II toxin-antitoxin system VapC family toxin [Gracilimonas sp.]
MIIDSNILIDFLKGNPNAIEFISQFDAIITSVVAISELYAGIISKNEMRELNEFLETSVEQIPVSVEIAKEAGLLRKQYGKSHGIRLPDAFIAATAIKRNLPVASLNKKHFSILTDNLIVPY